MRVISFALVLLMIGISCAGPRYQIPQTEGDLQTTVEGAETAYQALYQEHKAGQLSQPAMRRVDELYEAFRRTQAFLMDAVRAGALEFVEGGLTMLAAAVLGPAFAIAVEKLAPLIIDKIIEACERGEDPRTINWATLYGRSIAELRAEKDRQADEVE